MSKGSKFQQRLKDAEQGIPLPSNQPSAPEKIVLKNGDDTISELKTVTIASQSPYTGERWLVTSQSNTTSDPYTTQVVHQDIESWVIDNSKRHILFCLKVD